MKVVVVVVAVRSDGEIDAKVLLFLLVDAVANTLHKLA